MKKFFILFLMVFSFMVTGALCKVQAKDIIYDVSTSDELKNTLKKSKYSWDNVSIRFQSNITVSGDLDLGKDSLKLDLNYHSLSFTNADNGIIVDVYSWSKITVQNGVICGALDSNSALFPKNCYDLIITNVSIYGGNKYNNKSKGGHAISLYNSYSWTKVSLDYVCLIGGSGYESRSQSSYSDKGDAIRYDYSWDKGKIKPIGRGYTIKNGTPSKI